MKEEVVRKISLGLFAVYSLALLLGFEELAWFAKPLLIPSLLLLVVGSHGMKANKVLLLALFFSWVGDVLLMFAPNHDLFFITGLISFLSAHLVYIQLLWKQGKTAENSRMYLFLIPVLLLYLYAFLSTLWSGLEDMKIPVAIYACVISVMLLVAFRYYLNQKNLASLQVLSGALFFVASDSILAWDKFYQSLPLGSFLIMSTYLAAQFLLVQGLTSARKD